MSDCPACGAKVMIPGAAFCDECGASLNQSAPPEASVEEAETILVETLEPVSQSAAPQFDHGDDDDRSPVVLEINNNRFYMSGKGGVLQLRVAYTGAEPAKNVRLSIISPQLCERIEKPVRTFGNRAREMKFPVRPSLTGEFAVEISVTVELEKETQVYSTEPIIKVLDPQMMPETVQLNVDQSMHAGGNIGYGNSVRNQVAEGITKGVIKTVNDLLTQNFPDSWQVLDLDLDDVQVAEEEPDTRVQVLASMQRRQPMTCAALELIDQLPRQVLLVGAKREISLGRNRQNTDIVLRLFPRPQTDELTKQITGSRPHLVLSLRSNGLYITDQNTANGTVLNGDQLRGECALPLDRASTIEVAKVLQLRVSPFMDDSSDEQPDRYDLLGHQDELWTLSKRVGLRSLLIERINNSGDEEAYLIVYRWANIGSGCEMSFSGGPGIAGRIVRLDSGYWFEGGSADAVLPLMADGDAFQWQAVPVAERMEISVGSTNLIRVAPFNQYGL